MKLESPQFSAVRKDTVRQACYQSGRCALPDSLWLAQQPSSLANAYYLRARTYAVYEVQTKEVVWGYYLHWESTTRAGLGLPSSQGSLPKLAGTLHGLLRRWERYQCFHGELQGEEPECLPLRAGVHVWVLKPKCSLPTGSRSGSWWRRGSKSKCARCLGSMKSNWRENVLQGVSEFLCVRRNCLPKVLGKRISS